MAKKPKAESSIKPVYVICGKDDYLVSTTMESLLDRLMPEEQRPMALYQPDASDADIATVLDELRTLPFLAERRVVLIKKADSFVSANRETLEKYFDSPSPTGVLVLTVDSWAKTTRLAKKLPGIGELMDVGQLKPWQLPKFIAGHIKQTFDKNISNQTAQLLVELVGDDPGRLTSEAEKLVMYVGDKKAITSQDVESLIGHNRMFNAFAVIDAITTGNTTKAIERLRNMFASDNSAEYTVVGAFAFHFRKLFTAKALLQKGLRKDQAAKKAGVWANVDAFFNQLEKMSLMAIAQVLMSLAEIDYKTKTGGTSTKIAIENLIIRLAN